MLCGSRSLSVTGNDSGPRKDCLNCDARDGPVSAGVHSVVFNGSRYASGVYFYRFESAGLKKTGKMLLLK
jgi:hypothetical protein